MTDQGWTAPAPLRGFIARSLLFCLVALLGLWLPGLVVERFVPWRSYQNPRERILWDSAYDGSRVVLLGDSVFCSYYVNAPERTLWRRLESLSGEKVFPGAMNAPRLLELGLMAKLVAARWPRGTVVFIDLTPTRFISQPLETQKRGIHYDSLARIVFDDLSLPPGASLLRLQRRVVFALEHGLFLVRSQELLREAVSRSLWPRHTYVLSPDRDLDWRDLHPLARGRFNDFRDQCLKGDPIASLSPVGVIAGILDRAGMVPVFVLTPLNRWAAAAFSPEGGVREVRFLNGLHARTLGYLQERKLDLVDLYVSLPLEAFVDLIHTNARGDDLMAGAMADWLRAHPRPAASE